MSQMQRTTITMTQPAAWKDAWKAHMKLTSRTNFSEFVGEAVNKLIEAECKKLNRKNLVSGNRGKQGIHVTKKKAVKRVIKG